MSAPIAIGIDSFVDLRTLRCEFVDKTKLIQEMIDDPFLVLLLPRPRRCGKTLNMMMLDTFFGKRDEDYRPLFNDLQIAQAGDSYWEHFNRYPTIFISFKNLKAITVEEWRGGIKEELATLFRSWEPILRNSGQLHAEELDELHRLLTKKSDSSAERGALRLLSEWLHRIYGEKVLILIDEYDSPILEAWTYGHQLLRENRDQGLAFEKQALACYHEVIRFFRTFFGSALKGNAHLYKGVLTGILRISKESMFSELNNLKVRTILDNAYSDSFGFTEPEVFRLFERQGQLDRLPEAKAWYNGYRFGPHTVYNPWSVLNFLDQPEARAQPYWLNTSANELLRELMTRFAPQLEAEFQMLLRGEAFPCIVEANLVLSELESSSRALMALLVFSGYLKAELNPASDSASDYIVSVPNREVSIVYRRIFLQWIEQSLGMAFTGDKVQQLALAIVHGKARPFQYFLSSFTLNMLSFYDGLASQPEALYQGLMVGLCAVLEPTWRVRSNRETGLGRADLQLIPAEKGQPGAVLELKIADPPEKTLEQAIEEGLEQLKERRYIAELESMGVSPIHQWVLAFDGKRAKVFYAGLAGT